MIAPASYYILAIDTSLGFVCNSIVEGADLSLGRLLVRFLGCDPPAGVLVAVPCSYESQSDIIVQKFVESKSGSIHLLLFVYQSKPYFPISESVNGLVPSTRKLQRRPPRSSP
jgi:hypothetical protein